MKPPFHSASTVSTRGGGGKTDTTWNWKSGGGRRKAGEHYPFKNPWSVSGPPPLWPVPTSDRGSNPPPTRRDLLLRDLCPVASGSEGPFGSSDLFDPNLSGEKLLKSPSNPLPARRVVKMAVARDSHSSLVFVVVQSHEQYKDEWPPEARAGRPRTPASVPLHPSHEAGRTSLTRRNCGTGEPTTRTT